MFFRFSVVKDGLELYTYEKRGVLAPVLNGDLISGFMDALQIYSEMLGSSINQINFANVFLYIQTYGDFSIRVYSDDPLDKIELTRVLNTTSKEIILIFNELRKGEVISPELGSSRIIPFITEIIPKSAEVFTEPINAEKSAIRSEDLQLSDKNFWNAEINATTTTSVSNQPQTNGDDTKLGPQSKSNPMKIGICGLAKAGKTSISRQFFEGWKQENIDKIKPTIGLDSKMKHSQFLNSDQMVFDFGGQISYRKGYLRQPRHWGNIDTLLFIVDVTQPELFKDSKQYLIDILDVIRNQLKQTVRISIFLHKYDPGERSEYKENLTKFFESFNSLLPDCTLYLTTIKDSSASLAMIKSLYFSIPRTILSKIFNEIIMEGFYNSELGDARNLKSIQGLVKIDEVMFDTILLNSWRVRGWKMGANLQKKWMEYLTNQWIPASQNITVPQLVLENSTNSIVIGIPNFLFPDMSSEDILKVMDGLIDGIVDILNFKPKTKLPEKAGYLLQYHLTF